MGIALDAEAFEQGDLLGGVFAEGVTRTQADSGDGGVH
jgi:hypothetical protein